MRPSGNRFFSCPCALPAERSAGNDSARGLVLVERAFPRDLAWLVEAASRLAPGTRVAHWGFDPAPARRAAEARLAARGIEARFRAAWKPALHQILEEEAPAPGEACEILWPQAPPGEPEDRALRELFPAAELWPGLTLRPLPGPASHALLRRRDAAGGWTETPLFQPRRRRATPQGGSRLAACGWLRLTAPGARRPYRDAPLEAPVEAALFAAFDALRAVITQEGWHGPGPHFGDLTLEIRAPFQDRALDHDQALLSLSEILHEELYFGALDILRQAAGLPAGARNLRPGRILPRLVATRGPVSLRVARTPIRRRPASARRDPAPALVPDLSRLEHPATEAELRSALAAFGDRHGGEALSVRSRQGRRVAARVLPGAGAAVAVTGGQHANEPSGPPGALLAAEDLAAESVPLALCPLENPDGWALYRRLLRQAPGHMHHAARYTAEGCDLAHVSDGEGRIRRLMRAASGADLQISLHGYPAHEWLRPFTGYLPHGFEGWSLPRGVFLILRHAPGWEAPALAALQGAAEALNDDPEIRDLNRAQRATLARYAPAERLDLLGEIPVMRGLAPPVDPAGSEPFPVRLVVETPDETAQGPRLPLLVRAQRLAATGAARAWRRARAEAAGTA